jgi:hypothetical protein
MHLVCAVKYICSNIGEKPVNKEVGSKREVSTREKLWKVDIRRIS